MNFKCFFGFHKWKFFSLGFEITPGRDLFDSGDLDSFKGCSICKEVRQKSSFQGMYSMNCGGWFIPNGRIMKLIKNGKVKK